MAMALKKVKGTLERVLDKNLQDLVRGIRNHKDSESKFIAECIDEIKQELRNGDLAVKANAVNKLTYLQMLGYDISWAAFNVIEVMTSSKFTHKRIGYLAASQSFHEGTDVLMLTTNMIRKDLSSQNMYDAGVALNGLACFVSPDLARDLANDIMTLMMSTKPYLRKKAVLIMYKVFLKFPDALRPAFPRLKEKLEDPDPGVQSAAVNVICELARKNPRNYLSLAPLFFKLMTSSTNNWVLIKIIKLFGALTPLEPRLGKKLIEPLTNLIHSTSAMSLLYECINTVIAVLISISSGVNNHSASIQLCVQKLRILIEDSDQNLKYLGLMAMSKILKTHPRSVQTHKDLILQCLDDKDESIRLRALDLLYGMVSKKNLMEIVKKLMIHMDKAEGSHYRDELLSKIIEICSQSNYQFITNFEWYVSVLVELTRIEGTKHGKMIASQMLDVAIRVQTVRPFIVAQMAILLENSHLFTNSSQRNGICEVLYAAAWICGEFREHLSEPSATLDAMLRPKVTTLPGHIQSVYVQNIGKLYSSLLTGAEDMDDQDSLKEISQSVADRLTIFIQSSDLEVQDRACCMQQLLKYALKVHDKGVKVAAELSELFLGELNPVAPKAQKKVPVPDGLDLDQWINDPPSESSDDERDRTNVFVSVDERTRSAYNEDYKKTVEPTEEELQKMKVQRKLEQENNPNYLKPSAKQKSHDDGEGNDNTKDIPVAAINLSIPLRVPGLSSSDKYLKQAKEQELERQSKRKRGKKKAKGKDKSGKDRKSDSEGDIPVLHVVSTTTDVPEGIQLSDNDNDFGTSEDDPHRQLDINLDEPLRDDERLPVRTHRTVPESKPTDGQPTDGATDKARGKRHRNDSHKKKDKKKEKKDKKEKHHHHHHHRRHRSRGDEEEDDQTPNLLVSTMDEMLPDQSSKDRQEFETLESSENFPENQAKDDMDFWLSDEKAPPTSDGVMPRVDTPPAPPTPQKSAYREEGAKESARFSPIASELADVNGTEMTKSKKKREKKEKREKKVAKEKKKEKARKEKHSEYIETEGVTTPSKEELPASLAATPAVYKLPPMSSYRLLGENAAIKMVYETRATASHINRVVISVVFTNLTTQNVKQLEFNVMDSLTMKLLRGPGMSQHDAIQVPFVLLPESQNEGQFAFQVESITMPQKLKGTLTYILKSDDGSSQDKLDFKLTIPCSAYLVGIPCNGDAYTKLLTSGQLSEKYATQFAASDADFAPILAKICLLAHFTVVEQVETSASLYSKSIYGHHVCLLVKQHLNGRLSIDGKSTDSMFLSNVIDDIKAILTN